MEHKRRVWYIAAFIFLWVETERKPAGGNKPKTRTAPPTWVVSLGHSFKPNPQTCALQIFFFGCFLTRVQPSTQKLSPPNVDKPPKSANGRRRTGTRMVCSATQWQMESLHVSFPRSQLEETHTKEQTSLEGSVNLSWFPFPCAFMSTYGDPQNSFPLGIR